MGPLQYIHTAIKKTLSQPVKEDGFRQMRAAKCNRDGRLKCLRASSVFGGAAQWAVERYPGGLFDGLMETDLLQTDT